MDAGVEIYSLMKRGPSSPSCPQTLAERPALQWGDKLLLVTQIVDLEYTNSRGFALRSLVSWFEIILLENFLWYLVRGSV